MRNQRVRAISFLDNLRFNVLYIVPYFTQGIFTRRRFWVRFWSRFHPDPAGVRFISRLRRKYRSRYLGLRLPAKPSILVLDIDGVREVLDHSPVRYSEPSVKLKGMAHFQPDALTISSGEEWRDRRRFNEAVLVAGHRLHPCADHFLEIVRREVDVVRSRAGQRLVWTDLQGLFEKIMLQVIFGENARDDAVLVELLNQLMRESNRLVALGDSPYFEPFYRRIRRYLENPSGQSLVALASQTPSSEATRVENQVPHWMFAMNETLAVNVAGALALIAAHRQAAARVRGELRGKYLTTATAIDRLSYLEGCLQEAMRLWPTTPIYMRQAVTETRIGEIVIGPQTQLIIHNAFNHRDRETYQLADTFRPESWPEAWSDYRFNHFSHGPRTCAGMGLALFIGKAVLANLLSQDEYMLLKPSIDPGKPVPASFDPFALELSRAAP